MGGEIMTVKRAKFGIHDEYRGVFLNRGVYIKAPPSFFQAYPSDFEAPPQGWQKLNIKVREIPSFDSKIGLMEAPTTKVEIPAPAPTEVSEVVVSAPQAVAEPVSTSDEQPKKRGRGRPRTVAMP